MPKKYIHHPSELIALLTELGAAPRKGLSQNFLIDGNTLRNICTCAKVTKEDLILEIGPGPGALTEQLLERGAEVLAVEKDRLFAKALSRLENEGRLHTAEADILRYPIETAIKERIGSSAKKAKVIANLPYHLTTPILERLLPLRSLFSSLTLMVQDEVAKRLTASPGNKEYGSLTVFAQFYANLKYAFPIPPTCFYPKPKVTSAVIHVQLRPPEQEMNEQGFFTLTRTVFQQRRKMLRSTLRLLYPKPVITNALETCLIEPTARPETLSLQQFLALFHALETQASPH